MAVFIELYWKHGYSDDFPGPGSEYAKPGLQPVSAFQLRHNLTAPVAAVCVVTKGTRYG